MIVPGATPGMLAFDGTLPGMVQLPPPVVLQLLARHCAAAMLAGVMGFGTPFVKPARLCGVLRFGLVQPTDSQPLVQTSLRAPAAPTSTPKLPNVSLARTE